MFNVYPLHFHECCRLVKNDGSANLEDLLLGFQTLSEKSEKMFLMFRVTENAVNEFHGYPFGYFWYCQFDTSFFNTIILKLHSRQFESFFRSKNWVLLFTVCKSCFRAYEDSFGYFPELRN